MNPLLQNLAGKYHELTEAFDRGVCTGPIVRGSIMPATPEQGKAITQNAREVFRDFTVEAHRLGFTASELQQAIVNHRKLR